MKSNYKLGFDALNFSPAPNHKGGELKGNSAPLTPLNPHIHSDEGLLIGL